MTAVRGQWDDPAIRQAPGAVLKARAGAEDLAAVCADAALRAGLDCANLELMVRLINGKALRARQDELQLAEDVVPRQAAAVGLPNAKSGRLWGKVCHPPPTPISISVRRALGLCITFMIHLTTIQVLYRFRT